MTGNKLIKNGVNNYEEEDIDILIREVAKKEGYTSYEVEKKKVSTDGENFLGTLHEVNINGNTKGGFKVSNIFVKKILPDSNRIDFGASHDEMYSREDFFYRRIVKEFRDLENEASVPEEERVKFTKFYDESANRVIIFENLRRVKGLNSFKRMVIHPTSFLEESIKQLAKFHAMSFVCKMKRPDWFEDCLKNIDHPIKKDKIYIKFMGEVMQSAVSHVREEYREKTLKFLSICNPLLLRHIRDSTSPCCCICHGDYKPNNILYSGSEENVNFVIPVDYQLIYYGCPVIDLVYFIYLSTDFDYRVPHMENMKNLYYTTLEQYLKRFKIDVNLMMPRTLFEEKFKEVRICGLVFFLQAGVFLFSEEGENIDSEAISKKKVVISDKYTERVNDTLKEFIDLGYL